MKMYKKDQLTLVNGIITNEAGDIIVPDHRIVTLANELETLAQKTAYLAKQPSATPMPTLDGFERESIKDGGVRFKASTPCLDWKVAEAEALMDEIDDVTNVGKANEMLEDFKPLVQFAKDDFVIDCGDGGYLPCFDMPTLGSVLKLTVEDITNVIADVCGLEIDSYDEDDED